MQFKTIAQGDIKPKNIIIRSSKTRPTDIVLTDYGTCGPDQIEQNGADKYKYAATSSHLPANRINNKNKDKDDGDNDEIGVHVSAVGTDCSKASTSENSQPRTTGNADDLFALGITGIELLLAENKGTIDPLNLINKDEHPINKLIELSTGAELKESTCYIVSFYIDLTYFFANKLPCTIAI